MGEGENVIYFTFLDPRSSLVFMKFYFFFQNAFYIHLLMIFCTCVVWNLVADAHSAAGAAQSTKDCGLEQYRMIYYSTEHRSVSA